MVLFVLWLAVCLWLISKFGYRRIWMVSAVTLAIFGALVGLKMLVC